MEGTLLIEDDYGTEDSSPFCTGTAIAAAITAGLVVFLVRRARHRPAALEERVSAATALHPWERARDFDFRGRTAAAGRDFLLDRLIPELKPMMLDLLEDARSFVDHVFRRAEATIKAL
jgi:hypothetical protein